MGKSILQLDFPDCTNEGVFLVNDISFYDPNLSSVGLSTASSNAVGTVSRPFTSPCDELVLPCANLQITPPGFTSPTSFSLTYSGFRLVLNACILGFSTPDSCSASCPDIPDGLYDVRYSISPNDQVYVEYKILRIVEAWNRYKMMLCQVGLTPCLPDADIQSQLRDLDTIRNYLLSAKGTVENLHQFTDGMNQYYFAVALMDKMSFEPTIC